MSTRTAFRTRDNVPVADGPCAPDVQWATIYFDPEDSGLNDVELVRLMMYRVVNRQAEVDALPMHHRYSHCLSVRIAGSLPDADAVFEVAEAMVDYFYNQILSGAFVVNRCYIFRRRSVDLFTE
ncbi:hypothetical protein N7457_000892 [Penicillium paradoxum]|uniref:uncharacterized protein n=1 Tax=Penicillium paradoxum TaxID=176176 RepID=UPI002548C766|nr:uncharacterized protein N7457_000892 [Penicillium paradoxum]KAJ5794293.1 hypothetical protein N7457_000892 [Penicillium paradoxum]